MNYTKPLSDLQRSDINIAGGKGANLGALIHAQLPVPDGFVVLTSGYREFVAQNGLQEKIQDVLNMIQSDVPADLDRASEAIHSLFVSGKIPDELVSETLAAYASLGESTAVAVRSSATAEDLPDLSFAGQQDTYLNIVGKDALLQAIVNCWASLWTARAIGYRTRNHISHNDVTLAVVVQKMVQSEASGVLFTANPLTGKRNETVIDATLGLGEAMVSGQVDPDHYVVEMPSDRILTKTLGAKGLSIQGKDGGGTVSLQLPASDRQALPDAQIMELARLGQKAQSSFGSLQDMEWAWADGRLYVVQSRPITSLYPLPDNVQENPLEILFSFGVWQGMLDPYTPIGQDVFKYLIVGFARNFGEDTTPLEQRAVFTAGERIFVNITNLLKSPQGRTIVEIFTEAIDPESARVIGFLVKDKRFSRLESLSLTSRMSLLKVLIPLAGSAISNLISPAKGRARLEKKIDRVLDDVRLRCEGAHTLGELVRVFEQTTFFLPADIMPYLVGGIVGGQAPYQIMLRTFDFQGSQELMFNLTRGLPYNVTTQMDLKLWETARKIRSDAAAVQYFLSTDIKILVEQYHAGSLPVIIQQALVDFLSEYGIRGLAEIDLGRPRWREHPSNLFQALKSYLQVNPSAAPDILFEQGKEIAAEAQQKIVQVVRQQPGGFIKSKIVNGLIRRYRELGGLRETPKYFVVRLLSIYRYALLNFSEKLAAEGILEKADDVMFLHIRELKALAEGDRRDWKSCINERRNVYQRELRRTRIPRVMLTDGTAFYDAPTSIECDDPDTLIGTPVSAGGVEGKARVVFDPHGAQIFPGEILICPATDPAWTPLFLAAGGLVTEVGGMMTHGSVVAREYGIPAVVGVNQATSRLKTGQLVRVDGSGGTIMVME